MKTLSENWLTERHIDQEYKRYVLLAYLKEVNASFSKIKLFPQFNDLKGHYDQLSLLNAEVDNLFSHFPKEAIGVDLGKLQFNYQLTTEESDLIKELKDIIAYSIPKIKECVEDGNQIFEFIEEKISIEPIGIIPLDANAGYLLLQDAHKKSITVFQYEITVYDNPKRDHKLMRTKFIASYRKSFINTPESIKRALIKEHHDLANPAAFSIASELSIPLDETYLPIAKQLLSRLLSSDAMNVIN